ncbi:MAG: phosphoglucomutase (alpha-D-glucose-1,6-bisphosphate-dependent), partial [Verrucomicrobiota bacterium]
LDPADLERAYYERTPDLGDPNQRVSFGTSGHRGTPLDGTFTDAHIAAITQAVCDYRVAQGNRGVLFLGKDTHAVSTPAERTAIEVLAANGVTVILPQDPHGFTPTPAVSRAVLVHNRGRDSALADGLVITPSHNPPQDGGFKYNPPNGGPADTEVTDWVQRRANELLQAGGAGVRRQPLAQALAASTTRREDLLGAYVDDLASVIDLGAIRRAGLRIGVDPLGGASAHYWQPIAERHGLDLTVLKPLGAAAGAGSLVDPTFGFMTVDHDGKIRMDCSSPYAMAGLVGLKDPFDIAWGCDPDADRHGIVTRSAGLLNPNHYLAVAIRYLLTHRPQWPAEAVIGKTVVSSSLIDRVVASLGRRLMETPVGFKWFAPGLFDGTCVFGGEESAGASFERLDGTAWSTDKDGLLLGLLAAEITAVSGKDPGQHYAELTAQLGAPCYTRLDAAATPEQKNKLKKLSPEAVKGTELAGEPIVAKLTQAPGNGAGIGGLKVVSPNGWFAARPSGTENIYKLYAESFLGADHLRRIVTEAQDLVAAALR